jgi:hypothetical protein
MKKVFLFVAVVAASSFASCKKDRVCTCTTTTSGGSVIEETTYHDVKKADARQMCIGHQTVTTYSGSPAVTGDDTTCELK